jgi:hypothetical protein
MRSATVITGEVAQSGRSGVPLIRMARGTGLRGGRRGSKASRIEGEGRIDGALSNRLCERLARAGLV